MSASVPTARVLIGPTSVPEGPHKEFPRQLVEQFEHLARAINNIRIQVDEAEEEGAPVGYFPRVKSGGGTLPTTADPYAITWEQLGTLFCDVGATAATGWQLPSASSYPRNLEEEVPWFRFVNTSGQDMRIVADAEDTIQVDTATATAAGGHVDLVSSNSTLLLGLVDDRWRALSLTGYLEVDEP